MEQEILFIPLGGGQRVGASCYYLRIGNSNIVLDAGIAKGQMAFGPDFHFLIRSPFMESMSQIDQIFISHAHMDHVGYLLRLMQQAKFAGVYMTEITKSFAQYQLYDRRFIGSEENREAVRLTAKGLLERVATVSYLQSIDFHKYKATFYPAGHIPGAMMVLFEVGKRKILYTGDYSLHSTALTQGCMIPEGLDIDTVILCGLHAKHSDYIKQSNELSCQAQSILTDVCTRGQSVLCRLSQLSKGIEFLKELNEWNTAGVPIYLDDSVLKMVTKMERLSIPILEHHNKLIQATLPTEPHIYITSDRSEKRDYMYRKVANIDFTLHEDFEEMKMFLKKINAKQAVIVHCDKERSPFEHTIERELMLDSECRTQVVFAEEQEVYRL